MQILTNLLGRRMIIIVRFVALDRDVIDEWMDDMIEEIRLKLFLVIVCIFGVCNIVSSSDELVGSIVKLRLT
jgi:hypothetical protein